MLSPVVMLISHENTIETSLTSKKYRLAKFCKVDACSQVLLSMGETSFSSCFSYHIPKIFVQTEEPTKYQSSIAKTTKVPIYILGWLVICLCDTSEICFFLLIYVKKLRILILSNKFVWSNVSTAFWTSIKIICVWFVFLPPFNIMSVNWEKHICRMSYSKTWLKTAQQFISIKIILRLIWKSFFNHLQN